MSPKSISRKAAFKAALAVAGVTVKDWCEQREPKITPSHLYAVLGGIRQSASLLRDVDEFIATHLPKTTVRAA